MVNIDNKKAKSAMWIALGLAWELGYLIAIPLVVLGFIGAYMDRKFETSPLLLLIGIVLAFVITSIGIYRKIAQITSEIDNVR